LKLSLRSILIIIGIIFIASLVFFIITTTVSEPTTINLYMPKDSEKDTLDQYSRVRTKLTLILLKDDKVFGYYGDSIKGGRSVSGNDTDKLIADGLKLFSKDSLVVVIKPTKEASYKATVDMLDQMSITKIEKYSMTDLNKQEKEFLKTEE
jgi:biopolymer transport protein ExbD